MKARTDKKLTQAQLAQVLFLFLYHILLILVVSYGIHEFTILCQLINEKPQVIQEYEAGKAIPNQQIVLKLERVLGVKLRGKK